MITKRKYPWIGMQDWKDIVFLHWPVDPDVIRPYIPSSFQLDLFDDKAWISVVLFQAQGTRGRWMPKFTALPTFYQVNVRTYVYHEKNAERGVYFLKMYTDSLSSIIGAKNVFHLPFQYANFSISSNRKIQMKLDERMIFSATFEPKKKSEENMLSNFLTERYCIWNIKGKNIIKIPILHKKWSIQHANVKIYGNHVFPFIDELDMLNPVSHYSPYKHSVIFPYETIGKI